jgi:hypothetical protein
MKKFIFVLAVLAFVASAAIAQQATPITRTVFGVTLGVTSQSQAKEILSRTAKDIKDVKLEQPRFKQITAKGLSYGGVNADLVRLEFLDDKLYSISIIMLDLSDAEHVKNRIKRKYPDFFSTESGIAAGDEKTIMGISFCYDKFKEFSYATTLYMDRELYHIASELELQDI